MPTLTWNELPERHDWITLMRWAGKRICCLSKFLQSLQNDSFRCKQFLVLFFYLILRWILSGMSAIGGRKSLNWNFLSGWINFIPQTGGLKPRLFWDERQTHSLVTQPWVEVFWTNATAMITLSENKTEKREIVVGKERFRFKKDTWTVVPLFLRLEKMTILRPLRFVCLQFQVMCLTLRLPATMVGRYKLGRKTLFFCFWLEQNVGYCGLL